MTQEERDTLGTMQAMMARIDERTRATDVKVQSLCDRYVTQDEFKPVKAIAFGLVALITTAAVLAMLGLVLKSEPSAKASTQATPTWRSIAPSK